MRDYQPKHIEYSSYYVAFLDILGFKNLVSSKKIADKKKIESYFGIIEEVTAELVRMKSGKGLRSIIISDSVILSVPLEGTMPDSIKKLRHLCVAVGKIQATLALKGIWLRGAISSGEAFFDDEKSNVVGQAYVNAYLLENRQAIFPRVILDNRIIKELRKSSAQDLIDEINFKNNPEDRFENWDTDILFDWKGKQALSNSLSQDLPLFVDYLSQIITDIDTLKTIKNNIEANIYSDNSIYSKFRWVLNYLVASCEWKAKGFAGAHSQLLRRELIKLKRY